MELVCSTDAVTPIGPYSQAVKAKGFIFVSGQIPATADGKPIDGTVSEKTHKMCQNASAVLRAAGSGLDKVVKVQVFFQNFDDFSEFNETYASYFPNKPARTSVQSLGLPAGATIMMDILALD